MIHVSGTAVARDLDKSRKVPLEHLVFRTSNGFFDSAFLMHCDEIDQVLPRRYLHDNHKTHDWPFGSRSGRLFLPCRTVGGRALRHRVCVVGSKRRTPDVGTTSGVDENYFAMREIELAVITSPLVPEWIDSLGYKMCGYADLPEVSGFGVAGRGRRTSFRTA